MRNQWERAMLVVAPTAFLLLRIVGAQLEEQAVDRKEPPPDFAADLLARPELFSAGVYLTGLGGLALLWFVWQLRQRNREAQGNGGQAVEVAWAAGSLWALLVVLASLLGATAPVIAKHHQDAEGARLFATVEFPVAPLGLTLFGAFAVGNGRPRYGQQRSRGGSPGPGSRSGSPSSSSLLFSLSPNLPSAGRGRIQKAW